MRRVTRKGVIAVAAASGAMAVAVPAYADAGAEGITAGSPGVGSGNTVQLPVHIPVNVCGNTVNVVGLLNPAAGNTCVNEDTGERGGSAAGSSAVAEAQDSPGVLSGNGVQTPVDLPVNVSGNSVNVAGAGHASVGNTSTNTSGERPDRPDGPEPAAPPRTLPDPAPHAAPPHTAALADTGADRTLPVLGTGAALFLGGVALYRRARLRTYG
ncbi:LAXTG-anchored chaplin ChpB [Streptomyces atrovirens]|uniref:Chaplin n=1 Tax=Streptomyces atrovirens TaxID=285556 RepID=A0ABW0DNG4_9ACTN